MSLTFPGRSRRLAPVLLVTARGTLPMVALLPGGDQPADDRLNAVVRQFLGLFPGLTGEGVIDDHYGVLRQPQSLSPDACRPGKRVRDDGDGGASPLFGFDPVVETPRGAGPSIGDRVDDRIAGAGQLVQD